MVPGEPSPLFSRRAAPISGLRWFRALIPSWRFFDHPSDEAQLLYRLQRAGTASWGEWRDAFPAPAPRGVLSLFHNPEGTLRLALYNLLERSLAEINEAPSAESFAEGATYGLLVNWVSRLTEGTHVKNKFQFKIVTRDAGGQTEERLVSATHD